MRDISAFDFFLDYLVSLEEISSIFLGGSRVKENYSVDADYDFFCVISTNFDEFRERFAEKLEQCLIVKYAVEYSYIENWGYLYKVVCIPEYISFHVDISIISTERVSEMALRSTNRCLFDRYGNANDFVDIKKSEDYEDKYIEKKRQDDYLKLFGFWINKFYKAIAKDDYWTAVTAIEKMKNNSIRYTRIVKEVFSGNVYKPEKYFLRDFPQNPLHQRYIIDGSFEKLVETAKGLIEYQYSISSNKDILDYYLKHLDDK